LSENISVSPLIVVLRPEVQATDQLVPCKPVQHVIATGLVAPATEKADLVAFLRAL
jgi:hypothetical protein